MTIPQPAKKTVSRLSSCALLLVLSCVSFIGCGGPATPQIKKIVITETDGSTSTRSYSYTNDDELSRVVISMDDSDTVARLDFSYRDGQMKSLGYQEKVRTYGDNYSTETATVAGTYSEDRLTGFKLSFVEYPGFFLNADVGYNSEGFIRDIAYGVSFPDSTSSDRSTMEFDYTSDALFDRTRVVDGGEPETAEFEYNSEDLISAIEERQGTDTERYTFSYNDDGQLRRYRGELDCYYMYNDDDLVEEIDCGRRIYKFTYNQGETVSGMIPRLPGIEYGNFFSLDGKSLTPEDFVDPYTHFMLLDW